MWPRQVVTAEHGTVDSSTAPVSRNTRATRPSNAEVQVNRSLPTTPNEPTADTWTSSASRLTAWQVVWVSRPIAVTLPWVSARHHLDSAVCGQPTTTGGREMSAKGGASQANSSPVLELSPVLDEVVSSPVLDEVVSSPVLEEVVSSPVLDELASTPIVVPELEPVSLLELPSVPVPVPVPVPPVSVSPVSTVVGVPVVGVPVVGVPVEEEASAVVPDEEVVSVGSPHAPSVRARVAHRPGRE